MRRFILLATTLAALAIGLPAGAASAASLPAGHVSKCSNANAKAIKVKTNNPDLGGYKMTITRNPGRCWLRAGGVIREIPEGFACTETDTVPIRKVGDHETIEPYDVQGCQWVVAPGNFYWTTWGTWYNNSKGHRVFKQFGHRSLAAARRGASCAARSSCFYPQVSFGGTPLTVLNTSNENTWTSVPPADRQSVAEAGGSDLWLWDRQKGVYTCVKANGGQIADESPFNSGYYYIDYGVAQDCTEPHPAGAPGSAPARHPAVMTMALRRYICGTGNDCFFSGTNEDGSAYSIVASDYDNGGWTSIRSGYRGSASNKSSFNLWTVNVSADDWTCFSSPSSGGGGYKGATGAAGWFYVNGAGGCQDCPPTLPPGDTAPCPSPAIAHAARAALSRP